MTQAITEYVLSRVQKLEIRDVFGVAGDFAFPIDDAVVNNKQIRWIGGCNELYAAYSADGYARIHSKSSTIVNKQRARAPRASGIWHATI
jgi:indolepyruvate decarboxylase